MRIKNKLYFIPKNVDIIVDYYGQSTLKDRLFKLYNSGYRSAFTADDFLQSKQQ